MNLVPKFRKIIMEYFKKTLGYGYRCRKCDRNATISEAFVNKFGFDYVKFNVLDAKEPGELNLKTMR